ncbi:MAG: AAA family ATPase [Lachnospiraceae bacterium]|nr:AAA family ATPase [Lachnospiraceae bacterium]
MNIKRAKKEIKDTIEAYLLKDESGEYVIPRIRQRPVLLIGAPGIGKTQIMEQIARECRIGLVSYSITHHTRQSAIGLPFISKQAFDGREFSVTEYTMSEIVSSIYKKMETTGLREGILFIDEINCVSETLAPAMLQFLQCKTFGSHEVPNGWLIVAAGNPPEYNKSVRDFDVVTMDRVKKIDVEPDYTVWKEYALKEQVHPAVISYLDVRPGSFYKMETTVDGRKFATPRGWEDLSTMLKVYETLGKDMDREVVAQYIQHEMVAKDFANYLDLYRKYQTDYQLDAVLEGRISEGLLKKTAHASFDERVSLIHLLFSRCQVRFAAQIREDERNLLLYEQLKLLKGTMLSEGQTLLPEGSDAFGSDASGAVASEAVASGAAAFESNPTDQSDRQDEKLPVKPAEQTAKQSALSDTDNLEDKKNRACACVADRIAEFSKEYEQKKTAGLLTREEDRRCRQVAEQLEAYREMLQNADISGTQDAWSRIQAQFEHSQDVLDASFDAAGEQLEHAFDFIEAAFGNGQEAVLFITNLNSDYYSVRFLQQYECERYYRYNKELLFDERSRSIEARLDALNL